MGNAAPGLAKTLGSAAKVAGKVGEASSGGNVFGEALGQVGKATKEAFSNYTSKVSNTFSNAKDLGNNIMAGEGKAAAKSAGELYKSAKQLPTHKYDKMKQTTPAPVVRASGSHVLPATPVRGPRGSQRGRY